MMLSSPSCLQRLHPQPYFRAAVMFLFFIATGLLLTTAFGLSFPSNEFRDTGLDRRAPVLPLQVFQVEAPLRASYDGTSCQQVIVQHNFANSYGSPYIGTYTPPKDCDFTTTIFNLSVTSTGINYDRLGLIFFRDIEVWRTTTAMPVRTGIYWNFQKDMTIYDTLLRSEQKVIMELDNLHDSVFTGNYNVTITALYYNDHETVTPANLILPISTQSSAKNETSAFSLPGQNATVSFTFPRNVERAVVSILASGNGDEEFWFRNVVTEYDNTFNNSVLHGCSSFREIQLLADGELAGVSWPFPIIFTGGISPGLWVPIVGIDTYDQPSFEIDISPWLGKLCDGMPHSFELRVVGYDSETTLGSVGSNWWVSGAIFLWIDSAGAQTTGTTIQTYSPDPLFQFAPHLITSSGTNISLTSQLTARRTIYHASTITTSSGPHLLTWIQSLTYSNTQNFTADGYNKTVSLLTTGTSIFSSSKNLASLIRNSFSYPISFFAASTVPVDPTITNSTLYAELDRSLLSTAIPILSYLTSPSTFGIPETVATRQNGSCLYLWNNTYYEFAGAIDPAVGTTGATEQWFSYKGPIEGGGVEGYGRHVKAVDGYEPVLVVDETFSEAIPVPETESLGREELR